MCSHALIVYINNYNTSRRSHSWLFFVPSDNKKCWLSASMKPQSPLWWDQGWWHHPELSGRWDARCSGKWSTGHLWAGVIYCFCLLFHIWSKTQNTCLIYFAVSTFINAVPDSFWHLTRRLRLTTRATPGQAQANGRLKSLRFLSWTWCTKYSILVQTLHHLL